MLISFTYLAKPGDTIADVHRLVLATSVMTQAMPDMDLADRPTRFCIIRVFDLLKSFSQSIDSPRQLLSQKLVGMASCSATGTLRAALRTQILANLAQLYDRSLHSTKRDLTQVREPG